MPVKRTLGILRRVFVESPERGVIESLVGPMIRQSYTFFVNSRTELPQVPVFSCVLLHTIRPQTARVSYSQMIEFYKSVNYKSVKLVTKLRIMWEESKTFDAISKKDFITSVALEQTHAEFTRNSRMINNSVKFLLRMMVIFKKWCIFASGLRK